MRQGGAATCIMLSTSPRELPIARSRRIPESEETSAMAVPHTCSNNPPFNCFVSAENVGCTGAPPEGTLAKALTFTKSTPLFVDPWFHNHPILLSLALHIYRTNFVFSPTCRQAVGNGAYCTTMRAATDEFY